MAIAQFDYAAWALLYPALAATVNEALANAYFGQASLYLDNTDCSPIADANARLQLLNLVVAHIASLNTSATPRGLIGRITEAQEGSVHVKTADMSDNSALSFFFSQTPYGLQFWALTAQYRRGFYVPGIEPVFEPWALRAFMAEIKGGNLFHENMAALAKKVKSAHKVDIGFINGATYPDGTSVAMIAAINNFGAPAKGIPPRPFFSRMVAENSPEWAGLLTTMLKREGMNVMTALEFMGVHIEGELREAIIATNSPPNSKVTNLLKSRFPQGGQSFEDFLKAVHDVANGVSAPAGKPLVQSGVMLDSITSEVS